MSVKHTTLIKSAALAPFITGAKLRGPLDPWGSLAQLICYAQPRVLMALCTRTMVLIGGEC